MKLVKIGDLVINMDHVVAMTVAEQDTRLTFDVWTGAALVELRLGQEAASALWKWVSGPHNVEDLGGSGVDGLFVFGGEDDDD